MNEYATTLAALTAEYQDLLENHTPLSEGERKKALADRRNPTPRSEQMLNLKEQMRKLQDDFNRARARREVGRPMPWE